LTFIFKSVIGDVGFVSNRTYCRSYIIDIPIILRYGCLSLCTQPNNRERLSTLSLKLLSKFGMHLDRHFILLVLIIIILESISHFVVSLTTKATATNFRRIMSHPTSDSSSAQVRVQMYIVFPPYDIDDNCISIDYSQQMASAAAADDDSVPVPTVRQVSGRPTWQQSMIRISDPAKSLPFYVHVLGMTLIDTFDFPKYNFSLYFVTTLPEGETYTLTPGTQAAHDYLWTMEGSFFFPFFFINPCISFLFLISSLCFNFYNL